jgi:hypothetical protein
VAHSEVYAATLVELLPRKMQMVIDSKGYWTPYWMVPIKQLFQGLRKRSKLRDKNVDFNYVTQNIFWLDIKKEKSAFYWNRTNVLRVRNLQSYRLS